MVLTDRQRADLHAGIYEYLRSRPGDAYQRAAAALAEADPEACKANGNGGVAMGGGGGGGGSSSAAGGSGMTSKTPLLEKKWTAIPRLQKKVLELERQAAQNARIHAHRSGGAGGLESADGSGAGAQRRMLPRLPCQHAMQGHSLVITSVQVHPVFTIVVSGSEDGTIKVWDHESGEYIRTLKGHTNTVNSVSFTPTGSHLASCSADLSIKLWDFATYACLRTLRGHDHTISAVAFVPLPSLVDGSADSTGAPERSATTTGVDATTAGCQQLLSASRDGTVKLWDVETGFCDHTFTDHTDWVRCLAVRQSDGGLWASSGNDQTIQVYDNTKSRIVELRGHEHVVEALAFVTEEPLKSSSRESKQTETARDYLASGSRDRSVRLWKVSEASCVAIFTSHENWVKSVLIHPSGNYVISSSDDKTIRVFDIKAKRCLRTLDNAHNHFVTTLDMHHTLPILVSGSVDQTLRCWLLD